MKGRGGLCRPVILTVDLLAFYAALALAYHMRLISAEALNLVPLGHPVSFYVAKWWMPLILVLAIGYFGGYSIMTSAWDDMNVIWRSLFVSFLIVWVVLSLQKEAESVSRLVITAAFLCLALILPLFRYLTKYVLYRVLDWRRPAYLYERRTGLRREGLMDALNREWYSGFHMVGTVTPESAKEITDTCFLPVEYADETTIRLLKPKIRNLIFVSILSGLSFMNTDIKTYIGKDLAIITTSNGLLSIHRIMLKRVIDVFLSAALLLLLSPLFLCIPLLIRMTSRGPALFTHRRCGKGLHEFGMLKFRTMRTDGDGLLSVYLAEHPEAVSELKETNKLKDDPRVTGLGKILRKTSLDEIPQLINVLKGDMSIVGPRPDSREAIEGYYGEYGEIYERIRPGITGLWQVSGRSDVGYAMRVKLDYIYVLNWSPWLDLTIIIKTIHAIASRRGAY